MNTVPFFCPRSARWILGSTDGSCTVMNGPANMDINPERYLSYEASISEGFLVHQYEKLMFWYEWLRLCNIYSFTFVSQHQNLENCIWISFAQCHESNMAFYQQMDASYHRHIEVSTIDLSLSQCKGDFLSQKFNSIVGGWQYHWTSGLARLTAIQEDPGSIPGYTLEIFLEV